MGARQALGRLVRASRRALQPRPEAFPATEGQVLRDEQLAQHAQTTKDLAELRTVVVALQEQLDRWSAGCTAATDALSERLASIERTNEDREPMR